jgi:cystathionine gamma-lyase
VIGVPTKNQQNRALSVQSEPKSPRKPLASLEVGGSTALALASGSAATSLFIAALVANARIISVNDVYSGSGRYLRNVASVTQNLSTTFVDLERATDEELLDSFKNNTHTM